MSYYDPQSWQLPIREAKWEQQQTGGSRSDPPVVTQREDAGAFTSQLEDVERAIDNLAKSGKLFLPNSRRESMSMMGGMPAYSEFQNPRMGGMGSRHHSVDYDQGRPQSGSGLQMFYANQRHQSRPNDGEQMAQAKRRMAAQRERELRNYHQEQQYNRNVSTQAKSDPALSPSSAHEEDRHELIARQHRALYGKESGSYGEGGGFGDNGQTPRPSNPNSGPPSAVSGRGPSPRTYDHFAMGQNSGQSNVEVGGQFNPNEPPSQSNQKGPSPNPQQQRSRADSTSSPASNPAGQTFTVFESAAQQSSRTSTSSPGQSPPRQSKTSAPGVAPIGTRPVQAQAANPALNKRSGTPSASPLSYSFAASESLNATANNERSTSSASNPSGGAKESNVSAWGAPNSAGPWGNNSNSNNKSLGVQASVWG